MTRSTAREIAVHLVYGMDYTHASGDETLETLLDAGYYSGLSHELELYSERPNKKQMAYIRAVAEGCVEKREELDEIIGRYAIGWAVSRICVEKRAELDEIIGRYAIGWAVSRISRLVKAILYVAIYEVRYVDDVPTGVAINEAVRLTRIYEDEDVVGFVNGILGAFARAHDAEKES